MEEVLRKICGRCKIKKDITNFWKNKCKKDGYQNYCISCMKKTTAADFQKHKKKRMAKSLEYQKGDKFKKYHNEWVKRSIITMKNTVNK
jgi:hypothetical protein